MKSCDTDEGGCGQMSSIQHLLEGTPPRVFTMQLAWESHAESADAIRDTLAAVQEVQHLPAPARMCPSSCAHHRGCQSVTVTGRVLLHVPACVLSPRVCGCFG